MGDGMKAQRSDFICRVNRKILSADSASSPKNGSLCQITASDVAEKRFSWNRRAALPVAGNRPAMDARFKFLCNQDLDGSRNP
jgi:hypothetical protein